jgi:hypothetical protein
MEHRPQHRRSRAVKKRRIELLPKRRSGDPRASVAAFLMQMVLIAIIVPAFLVPVALDFLRDDSGAPVIPERISFEVLLPTDRPTERAPARAGGDGREASDEPVVEAPPIVTPGAVPTGVPVAPSEPQDPSGGVGPLVGGGGPLRGIQPSFTDQRLWVRHGDVPVAPIVPLSRADTLRILLQERVYALEDSLARYGTNERAPGDWTFDLGGRKYGIDGGMIRLGKFSLPTAALAMLPLNVQSNPIAMERAKRLETMRAEIQTQAARAMRDDEFYAAVKALRERKERERREAEREAQQPPPIIAAPRP